MVDMAGRRAGDRMVRLFESAARKGDEGRGMGNTFGRPI